MKRTGQATQLHIFAMEGLSNMLSNREEAMIEECEHYRDECARLRDLLEDRKYVVADALECLADLRRVLEDFEMRALSITGGFVWSE